MTHLYRAYGVTVEVPFTCPALRPAGCGAKPDVTVIEAPVPERLEGRTSGESYWDAKPGSFLLRGGGRGGRFLVGPDGVTLQREAECDDNVLARLFCDAVLASVACQRGLLVLHANAVETDYGVVAVTGESGAGKSTTLAALLDRGCRMVSDDVTALRLDPNDGVVEVTRGGTQTHLTEDAAAGLGYSIDAEQLQPWRRMKAAVTTKDAMAADAGPLRAVHLLEKTEDDVVSAVEVAGAEKFELLMGCIYGPVFAGDHEALFPVTAALTATVPFYRLRRPAGRWTVADVADTILGHMKPGS